MTEGIIIFTPSLEIGGIERVMINYANLLSDKNYDITYLICHEYGQFESLLNKNIRLVNLKKRSLRLSIIAIANFLRKSNAKYLLTANTATIAILLAKVIARSKIKIITSHHNYINKDIKSIIDKKLIWRVYNKCEKVIAVSQGIEDFLSSKGIDRNKLVKIYNPINFDEIRELSTHNKTLMGQPYILYVGRFSGVKNLGMLISAFSKIEDTSIKLVLIGDGPERESLLKQIENLGLKDRVKFLGQMDNPYPYIKDASVIALSSESEAFPTILLESLALGKTIVSTPTEGALEILKNGELGYITDSYSPNEFSETLKKALGNQLDEYVIAEKSRGYFSEDESYRILRFKVLI